MLPINKTEKKNKQNQQNTTDRNYLVAAARDGDENAIENLTLEDIDTYSMLSRRITHEDAELPAVVQVAAFAATKVRL